jgi:serine/threonine-protein kinase
VLSVGPAYALGLHSAFVAVIATMLFAGGLFRAPHRESSADRLYVLLAVVIAHGVAFAAIRAGAVPDAGNLRIDGMGSPAIDPLVHHIMVQFLYVAAFAGGTVVDRRFADAFRRAEHALRKAARTEEELARARAGLARAVADQGGGLFTGSVLDGFKVGRLIGRGGMGEVYEARRDDLGGRVALKLLRGDRAGDPSAVARFAAEAAVLTRIDSPYVARVLAAGGEDHVPYIAMEHVDGRSLAQLLRERGRLTPAGVVSLIRHVTEGLSHVHAAGIAHLDIKPSNILLTEALDVGSRWRLVDFGVARLVAAKGAAPERVAGTPQYMSPEQALGETVDTRADLYSLSAVVYRALTGRPPFTREDAAGIAQDARRRGPPDPRHLVAVPADVGLALRIGLSPWAEHRYATATELRVAFERAFDGVLDEPMRARARALVAAAPWTRDPLQ